MVQNAGSGKGIHQVAIDGVDQPGKAILLVDDRVDHKVLIVID
jgi:hypothetical protein